MAINPGENLAYVKELVKRYEAAVKEVKKAEDPHDITIQERRIQPVLNELQMAVPRIYDDFIRVARRRREEIREM